MNSYSHKNTLDAPPPVPRSKSTLSDAIFDDSDNEISSMSERHHQIMEDGNRIIKRIVYGCLLIVTVICGFLYFLFWSWKA